MRLLWEVDRRARGARCGEIGWRREKTGFPMRAGTHVTSASRIVLYLLRASRDGSFLGDLDSRNNFASRQSSFQLIISPVNRKKYIHSMPYIYTRQATFL